MSKEPEIRCTRCGAEFTQEEIMAAMKCPACGSKGVPMWIKDDTTIKINKHELRILTIWADNYAHSIEKECPGSTTTIESIVNRLNEQLPDLPLTMRAEFQKVADHFNTSVDVTRGEEEETIKPKADLE